MSRPMQSNVVYPQQIQEQRHGDPLLGALGTFLPMAFGLPPIPQLGMMLGGGPSWTTQAGGIINPFMGGFPGVGGFGGGTVNPFDMMGGFA